MVLLDEVVFAVSSRPKKGRALMGTSAYVDVPAARKKNISVLAAMNKNCMIYKKVHNKALCGEDFKTALAEVKATCESIGIQEPVFIVDNARIHHYSGLEEVIVNLGLVLEYLPPYSPFLNPIENCFSKWKRFVIQGRAKNEIELKELIDDGFKVITEEDCNGFYRKMLKYIIKSERRETILE